MGSRDDAVVGALASRQCGTGSIPGLGVIYLLVDFVISSHPCSERIFSYFPGFHLSFKKQIPICNLRTTGLSFVNRLFFKSVILVQQS